MVVSFKERESVALMVNLCLKKKWRVGLNINTVIYMLLLSIYIYIYISHIIYYIIIVK